jgi:hypothetical protein
MQPRDLDSGLFHGGCQCPLAFVNVVKPFFFCCRLKKYMDSRKRAHPMSDETRERLVELEARNDVLSERLAAYESHIKDLEAFKANHQKVWGAALSGT